MSLSRKNKNATVRLFALVAIGITALISQSGISGISNAGKVDAKMPMARIGKDNIVTLEVATTEAEIQRGLMQRTSLGKDAGMVFIFNPPRAVNFWMYNCLMPLDMLFVRDGKIVRIFEHVPPCKSPNPQDCPTYPSGPGVNVTHVIEVNAGYAKAHDLKVGDPVSFETP